MELRMYVVLNMPASNYSQDNSILLNEPSIALMVNAIIVDPKHILPVNATTKVTTTTTTTTVETTIIVSIVTNEVTGKEIVPTN